MKSPTEVVVTVDFTPVAVLVTATVALGITAPLVSLTEPRIDPVPPVWAISLPTARTSKTAQIVMVTDSQCDAVPAGNFPSENGSMANELPNGA